jgi:serine/threonine protein phosphatase Stp1
LNRPDLGVWAVADGLGGYRKGAAAAAAVVGALDAIPAGLSATEVLAQVRLRLARVHSSLRAEAARLDCEMIASTVVVLIAHGEHFACLWAGDSRAYSLHPGEPSSLTRDHSLVQELLDTGAITAAEAATHPQANVITRAIGVNTDDPALAKVTGRLQPGEQFLLCSDGVWKTFTPPELAVLTADCGDVEPIIVEAIARNASDNVTAVSVVVGSGSTDAAEKDM